MKLLILASIILLSASGALAQRGSINAQLQNPVYGPGGSGQGPQPDNRLREIMGRLMIHEQRISILENKIAAIEQGGLIPVSPPTQEPPMGYNIYICGIGSSANCANDDYKTTTFTHLIESSQSAYEYNMSQCLTTFKRNKAKFYQEVDSINANGRHYDLNGYYFKITGDDAYDANQLCQTINQIFKNVIKDTVQAEPIWAATAR